MIAYRRSYWKTIVLACTVAAGAVAVLLGLWVTAWLHRGAWGPTRWLGWGGASVCLLAVAGWSALVAGGGVIALRRVALERRGVPYARRKPREWVAGPAISALRRALRTIRATLGGAPAQLDLRPGELVEVKSVPEILGTLDEHGSLAGLPFMPEMLRYSGQRLQVQRRVDKLQDWVAGTGLRQARDTVLLRGLRCDGRHHGGCQAFCHLRWNEAWLRRVDGGVPAGGDPGAQAARLQAADLERLASRVDESGAVRYMCQVTELGAGTTPLARADPRHFLRDLLRGNVRPGPLLVGIAINSFDWFQRFRGGVGSTRLAVLTQKTSPHEVLDLQPGEMVRVKRKEDIDQTLNYRSRNRGLWFDAEMVRFCGGQYRVQARVERLIEESTGRLIDLSTPCIILDGVTATGEYHAFCAQNEAILWREIWLERAG